MASRLKWQAGFDWGAVVLVVAAALVAAISQGVLRWLMAGAALLAGAWMAYRYRSWNRDGWRQVHNRAMLAYADILRRQASGGRADLGTFEACTALGLLLCGEDNRAVVNGMLEDLSRLQGAYLAGVFERHAAEALPGSPLELRGDIVARLRQMPLGPELVIGTVIENIHGGREAARYAVAVATGSTRP